MHAQRKPSVHSDISSSTELMRGHHTNVVPMRRTAIHLPAQAPGTAESPIPYQLPRPGEDGEPQAMSDGVFTSCLLLLAIGVLLVLNLHMAGFLK